MTPDNPYLILEESNLEVELAATLRNRIVSSCLMMLLTVVVTAVFVYYTSGITNTLVWIPYSLIMIVANYSYARKSFVTDFDKKSAGLYLKGYTVLWACIGGVWSGFAIYNTDPNSEITLFVGAALTTMITVGGLMPSSPHRPSYVANATCSLVPYSLFVLYSVSWPLAMLGFALLGYYGFCLIVSLRAEANTKDAIRGRQIQEMYSQIVEQNKIIKAASKEKLRFVSAASHDLAQPHHAMGYHLSDLRMAYQDDLNKQLVVDKLEQCWKIQGEIIKSISEVTQAQSGYIEPKCKVFELSPLLFQLIEENPKIHQKELKVRFHPESLSVWSDPVLVRRIFQNILANAVTHSPNQGQVNIRYLFDKERVGVSIADQGSGIPGEYQAMIFEPYMQIPDSGGIKTGLGLGLSIVKEFAQILGLTVEVESMLNLGACFTVWFTQTRRDDALIENQETPHLVILMIDGDAASRESSSLYFSGKGHSLLSASNFNEALLTLKKTNMSPDYLVVKAVHGLCKDMRHQAIKLKNKLESNIIGLYICDSCFELHRQQAIDLHEFQIIRESEWQFQFEQNHVQ